ncbi:MAG: hypothetical protein WCI51_18630, partial [Lentisphaerota bacterium]
FHIIPLALKKKMEKCVFIQKTGWIFNGLKSIDVICASVPLCKIFSVPYAFTSSVGYSVLDIGYSLFMIIIILASPRLCASIVLNVF